MSQSEITMLEHLERIRDELAAARERDRELLSRIASIEGRVACANRDRPAKHGAMLEYRDSVCRLIERVEKIERRLKPS